MRLNNTIAQERSRVGKRKEPPREYMVFDVFGVKWLTTYIKHQFIHPNQQFHPLLIPLQTFVSRRIRKIQLSRHDEGSVSLAVPSAFLQFMSPPST
jgi:hypothetical protein